MKFKQRVALVAAVISMGGLGVASSNAVAGGADPSVAHFKGRTIDLSRGWGEAGACAEVADVVDCFRTEAELLTAHPELGSIASDQKSAVPVAQRFAACSSSLRLYRGTGYSGAVLYLTTRSTYHNLSSYGFDNDTSSYKVGACSASFSSGSNGSGSTYPGSTSTYSSSSTMVSGWNNVVSSIFIY